MKHTISVAGFGYRLRPVGLRDAAFITEVRLADAERNQYIHAVSNDVAAQEDWINRYFQREGDYYFVVENLLTGAGEGLVGIYDVADNRAEWGRWVLAKGSLAAVESVDLMYKAAFDALGLDELYSRTIADNQTVVSFHDNLPQQRRGVIKDHVELRGQRFDVVEHYVTRDYYNSTLRAPLETKARMILERNFRSLFGSLKFHHIGVACADIQKEYRVYAMLGYKRESDVFEDPAQGIRGMFLTARDQPRLELLENLPGSTTLDRWLEQKNRLYHFAYFTESFDDAVAAAEKSRVRVLSPPKQSVYFGTRICFLVLPNAFIIELIEAVKD